MLKNDSSILTQCDNGSTDPTVNVVRYKLQERRNEQVDYNNSLKLLDKISHTDWQKELVKP